MKADKQRIEIAKLCGWMYKTQDHGDPHWCHPEINQVYDTPPDYPNDLNACAEMREAMEPTQRILFIQTLGLDVLKLCPLAGDYWMAQEGDCWAILNATAAQHCEAFLRTLGKWEDGE
jgi:hypothetical protein